MTPLSLLYRLSQLDLVIFDLFRLDLVILDLFRLDLVILDLFRMDLVILDLIVPVPTGSGDLERLQSAQKQLQHFLLTIEELEQMDDELLNF